MDSPAEIQSGKPPGRSFWCGGLTLFEGVVALLLCVTAPVVVYWVGRVGLVVAIRQAVPPILAVGFILTAVVGWSLARVVIPKITKYATPILFMLFVLFALLPGWLLQTREEARREHLKRNMMRMGFKIQGIEQRAGHKLSPDELELLLADPEFVPPGIGN